MTNRDTIERARAVVAADADLQYALGMRLGCHPEMLAMSVAGHSAMLTATHYRERLTLMLNAHGPDAIDTDPAHLERVTDGDGHATVHIVEAAFDVRPMIHGLQLAARAVVSSADAAREMRECVLSTALDCVCDELADELGTDALNALDDAAFAILVTAQLRSSQRCLGTMSPLALEYARSVATEAIERVRLETLTLVELERLLGLRPIEPPKRRVPRTPGVFSGGTAPIAVNHATWALQNAIRDAILGAGWSVNGQSPVPSHTTATNRGRGAVRVSLQPDEAEPLALPAMWEQVRALDDLTSDALLVCLALWAEAGDPSRPVWITADAILDARGIRRIHHTGEPGSWQHGHRTEDRIAAGRALAQLASLWLEIVDVEVIPERGGRPATRLRGESRALAVLDRMTSASDDGEVFLAARVVPGEWARTWWDAGLRQTGMLARKALEYDPYRRRPEKWLAKSLAYRFRWNARRRDQRIRLRVDTLLADATLVPDPQRPQRTRDRLERALDQLRRDDVIGSWAYDADPGLLPARQWLQEWLAMVIAVAPPMASATPSRRLTEG